VTSWMASTSIRVTVRRERLSAMSRRGWCRNHDGAPPGLLRLRTEIDTDEGELRLIDPSRPDGRRVGHCGWGRGCRARGRWLSAARANSTRRCHRRGPALESWKDVTRAVVVEALRYLPPIRGRVSGHVASVATAHRHLRRGNDPNWSRRSARDTDWERPSTGRMSTPCQHNTDQRRSTRTDHAGRMRVAPLAPTDIDQHRPSPTNGPRRLGDRRSWVQIPPARLHE
jgi:hypothetical protein